jgi:hypothetical protein
MSHTSINVPWILGKSVSGRFSLWSSIFFCPFLILARTYAKVKRFITALPGRHWHDPHEVHALHFLPLFIVSAYCTPCVCLIAFPSAQHF